MGSDVDILLLALKSFHEVKNFPVMRGELMQWATEHQGAMVSQELETILQQFVKSAKEQQALTEVTFDAGKVKDMIGKVPKPWREPLCASMIAALPSLMLQVLEQAGFQVMDLRMRG